MGVFADPSRPTLLSGGPERLLYIGRILFYKWTGQPIPSKQSQKLCVEDTTEASSHAILTA